MMVPGKPGLVRGSESAGPIFAALASITHCEDLWTLDFGPSFRLFARPLRRRTLLSRSRHHANRQISSSDFILESFVRICVRGRWQRGRCSGEVKLEKFNEAVALAVQGRAWASTPSRT